MPPLRLGTRGSALARIQTAEAAAAIRAQGGETRECIIQSEGDRDRRTPLRRLGGRGVFVRALEQALLDGAIDIAVHSAKDLPSALLPGTTLAALLPRADVRDALVARGGRPLAELPCGAKIGTGSRRRAAQLRARRPDLIAADIRGNVDTRLRKLAAGECDALLLAAAGLIRLGRAAGAELLPPDLMLPAPGRGRSRCNAAAATLRPAACSRPAATHPRTPLSAPNAECSLRLALAAACRSRRWRTRAAAC